MSTDHLVALTFALSEIQLGIILFAIAVWIRRAKKSHKEAVSNICEIIVRINTLTDLYKRARAIDPPDGFSTVFNRRIEALEQVAYKWVRLRQNLKDVVNNAKLSFPQANALTLISEIEADADLLREFCLQYSRTTNKN